LTTDRAEGGVIEARRLQRSFGDGLIAEEIEDLQETWMRHVDAVLLDEAIVSAVHQALSNRCPKSGSHGRPGYPGPGMHPRIRTKPPSQPRNLRGRAPAERSASEAIAWHCSWFGTWPVRGRIEVIG
jgi:hypothetical protein